MHRTRTSKILMVLGVVSAGLMAWALAVAAGPASGQVKAKNAAKVTVVTVTEGKPSELSITLSKFSNLPAGKITFKVTNKGQIAHNFKICTVATTAAKAPNTCKGVTTKDLDGGKSQSITVTLAKKGKYAFLCTLPGHAGAGMKGILGVGVKVAAPKTGSTTTPTPTPTSTTTTPATSTAKPCNSPVSSTVTVTAFDFGYTVAPSTVPCGSITFNMKNNGPAEHDFVLENIVGQGRTPVIDGGQSTSMTVTLTPATWTYYCSVPTHRGLGMDGKITVT
jgi:uncharacterized cupredoxin-like copper-binding protein